MRRLLVAVVVPAAGFLAVGALPADSGGDYRVAATFDTAKGIVAGQIVKVAGVEAGKVEDLTVAPGPTARIVLKVDRRFAPFRADARCRILPAGLISENFVECDPGTPQRPELHGIDDDLPTVPVERTSAAVSLQDLFNVFSLPTAQRLRVLLNELGMGTAGRGRDLNALLRRANPALAEARELMSRLNGQRREISTAIRQTDTILARLDTRRDDVRSFVRRSAAVSRTTASRARELSATVKGMPETLRAIRTGARSIDRFATKARPVVADLGSAAPSLLDFTRQLPAFNAAAQPALRSLSSVAQRARRVVPSASRTMARLARMAGAISQVAPDAATFGKELRDAGGFEGMMETFYRLAAFTGLYDETSHFGGIHINIAARCMGGDKNTESPAAKGCSHRYDAGDYAINGPDSAGAKRPTKANIASILEYLLR